ncbi:MAG TPA: hypothetical protein VGG75_15420 [Trebonia sp.]
MSSARCCCPRVKHRVLLAGPGEGEIAGDEPALDGLGPGRGQQLGAEFAETAGSAASFLRGSQRDFGIPADEAGWVRGQSRHAQLRRPVTVMSLPPKARRLAQEPGGP